MQIFLLDYDDDEKFEELKEWLNEKH